jgi:hypothetical protein
MSATLTVIEIVIMEVWLVLVYKKRASCGKGERERKRSVTATCV